MSTTPTNELTHVSETSARSLVQKDYVTIGNQCSKTAIEQVFKVMFNAIYHHLKNTDKWVHSLAIHHYPCSTELPNDMRCSLRFHDGQNFLCEARYMVKYYRWSHARHPSPPLLPLTPILPLPHCVPLSLSPYLSFLGGLQFDSFSTMLLLTPLQLIVR